MTKWSATPDSRFTGTHRYEPADQDGNAVRGIVLAVLISLAVYAFAALLWWLT